MAKVDPNLANRNRDGQIESVRYNAINAMLLNEFLKEHKRVEEQQSKIENQQATIAELKATLVQQRNDFGAAIAELKKEMETVAARLNEQNTEIQKVNAQIKLGGAASQMIANEP